MSSSAHHHLPLSPSHLSAASAIVPPRSPRMKRLAAQLPNIVIALNPPSPPPSPEMEIDIPILSPSFREMDFLQVPGVDEDESATRMASPPPFRRTSCASTMSELSASITIPLTSSYQCLLSPLWTTAARPYAYNSDDYSTPIGDRRDLPPRPKSAQEIRRHRLSPVRSTGPGGECICVVPPVLLSPVLSRPVRSQSAASSPLPNRNIGSDSDGDLNIAWRPRRSGERSTGGGHSSSRTATPTMSPILNRSTSASKLAASFAANRSSSGSGLLSARAILRRTDSDAADARRRRKGRRRPSFMSHGKIPDLLNL